MAPRFNEHKKEEDNKLSANKKKLWFASDSLTTTTTAIGHFSQCQKGAISKGWQSCTG